MSNNSEISNSFGTPSGRLTIATKAVQVLDAAGKLPQPIIPRDLVESMGRGFLKSFVSDIAELPQDKLYEVFEEITLRADATDKEGLVLYFKFILDRIWQKFSGSVDVQEDEAVRFPPLSDLIQDREESGINIDLMYLSSRVSKFIYDLRTEGFHIRDWSIQHNAEDVSVTITVMKNTPL